MEARCPHCSSVFETARTGPQFCPNCGQQVNVAEGSEAPGSDAETPWERRKDVSGLFETWKNTILGPDSFWQSVRPTGKMVEALVYSWIIQAVARALRIPFIYLEDRTSRWMADWLKQFATPESSDMLDRLNMSSRSVIAGTLISLILWPLILVIIAAITHLFCLLFGARKNGFEATFRVVCYASAPLVFAFHSCTQLPAAIYMMVLMIFGIAKVHSTTTGRAAGAVLTPFLICTCCVCMAAVAIFTVFSKGILSNM